MKYSVICSDPPYRFSDKLQHSDVPRGAEANYNTMSIEEIKSLPVKELSADDGAILALWVPSSLLQEGLDIMNAWGFKHKQTYIWVKSKKNPFKVIISNILKFMKIASKLDSFFIKDYNEGVLSIISKLDLNEYLSFGMGRLFRQCHEICLIGINNTGIYKKLKNKSQRSVSFGENLKHSAKPDFLQNQLELMFSGENVNFLEMFARRDKEGWTCLGNEVGEKLDIRESMRKIINEEDIIIK